jgi:hypothetical protein
MIVKLYTTLIRNEIYEVHRYWMPHNAGSRLKFLRKFFKLLDKDYIPHNHKRRKDSSEFADAALIILARLDQLFDLNVPFVAGSAYLSPEPWAMFGKGETDAHFHFKDMESIFDYYKPAIVRGDNGPEQFHMRLAKNLPTELSDKHRYTPNLVVAVAIYLLYDILINCGPDCTEFADLFSNDRRISNVDLNEWSTLRCKLLGVNGRIYPNPHNYVVGQINRPRIPLVTTTKIELVGDFDSDISVGERIRILRKTFSDPNIEDEEDSVNLDENYAIRVKDRIQMLPHLGLDVCC